MKNLILRTLTGIGFVAVVVACLLVGKYTFGVLMTGLMSAMMIEFYRMTMRGEYKFSQVLSVMAAMLLTLIPPVVIVLVMQRAFVRGLVDSEK